jgi:GNAT superfamily N-acetyltransferase
MKPHPPYQIRSFRPSDARGVATLFQSIYGGLYVYPDVYLPSAITTHNARQRWHSACAISEGQVIGHAALVFDAGQPYGGEFALGVVDNRWRKQGIAGAFGEHLVEVARSLSLRYLTAKQVSSHPHSQKLCRSLDYRTSAIFPDYVRSPFDTKGRESVVLGCLPLVPRPVPSIEWPKRLLSSIRQIAARFGSDDSRARLAPREAGLAVSQEGLRMDVRLSTPDPKAVREVAQIPSSRLVYVQMPLFARMASATNALLDAGYQCTGLVPTGADEWNLLLVRGHQNAQATRAFPLPVMESATASATRMPSMAADMMPPA